MDGNLHAYMHRYLQLIKPIVALAIAIASRGTTRVRVRMYTYACTCNLCVLPLTSTHDVPRADDFVTQPQPLVATFCCVVARVACEFESGFSAKATNTNTNTNTVAHALLQGIVANPLT